MLRTVAAGTLVTAIQRSMWQMREKMIAFGDDYGSRTTRATRCSRFNGKAPRPRHVEASTTCRGTVAEIQEKKLSIRDKIEIELHR